MRREPWLQGWRLTAARLMAIAFVIAISVYVFSIRDRAHELGRFGYPGIFLISILANATLILPAPGVAIVFAAGAVFNPLGVGLAAGLGSALGEITGYLAGFSGQGVIDETAIYKRLEGWTERFGAWPILILAVIPNPLFDIAGAAAGALRMPLGTFLLFVAVGKTIKMLAFALAGAYSIDWVGSLLGGS